MSSTSYPEGYWERGENSNYHNYGDDPGWPDTAQVIAEFAPVTSRVLEVACAKGYFIAHATARGFDAYGIDISEYALSKAPTGTAGRLVHGNAVELPWSDRWFDVVCSWEFMEHVYEDEIDTVISEMLRVLKRGGLFLHRIGISGVGGIPESSVPEQHDGTHVLEAPREWWEQKFLAAGFRHRPEIEKRFTDVFINKDWAHRYFTYEAP